MTRRPTALFALGTLLVACALPINSSWAVSSSDRPSRAALVAMVAKSVGLSSVGSLQATTPPLMSLTPDDASLPPHRVGCWSNSLSNALARKPEKTCAYGDLKAKNVLLLTGDSIAGMWLPTFNAIGQSHHWKVVFLGMRGCAPWGSPNDPSFVLYGTITTQQCSTFSEEVARWAIDHRPRAIFLAGRAYPKGRNFDKTPALGPFKVALGQAMKRLRPSGASLFIMGPTPRYSYKTVGLEPKDCLAGLRGLKSCQLAPKALIPSTEATVEQYYNDANRIHLVDTRPFFCTNKKCTIVVADHSSRHLIYFDGVHINRYYAEWISNAVWELLAPNLK